MMALLAHQGGWDEILLVAGPLAAFSAVLWLANRRANVRLAAQAGDGAGKDDLDPTSPAQAAGDQASAIDPLDIGPE